jgi:hypothetical protein
MSQNPAHSHRRALAPPAVTRFQLRTASASEAVFSPPFVPPRPEASRYSSRRTAAPITYEPTPPRPESTPPRPESTPPRPESAPPRTIAPPVFTRTPDAPTPRPATPMASLPPALPPPARPLELTAGKDAEPRTFHLPPPTSSESADPSLPPQTELPWELEAMTTPDYVAPRSIHDPEHDSWPVSAPDGAAVPAWGDAEQPMLELTEESVEPVADDSAEIVLDDIVEDADEPAALLLEDEADEEESPELLLDDEADGDAEDDVQSAEGPYLEPEGVRDATFPLDAFIVPSGVEHAPAGYDMAEVGTVVAERLENLATQIREQGIAALGNTASADELSRVLGAIVTGYVSRKS